MESFGFRIGDKNNAMKQLRLFIFSLTFLSPFFSCNSRHSSFEENKTVASDISIDSIAAVMDNVDQLERIPPDLKDRDFRRTASLRFKTNDVGAAIIEAENKVRALGGYVSLSMMKNSIQDSNNVQKTEDSLIRTVRYLTQAELVLRVPDTELDSLLTSLARTSTMMYSREIHCDDVSIQLLDSKLNRKRAETAGQRLKTDIDNRGKKLVDIGEMEKSIEEKDAFKDDAQIESLHLKDAVKYSTVSIEISQEPFIQYTEIARERTIPEYKLPFLTQLGESFSAGWQFLQDLTVFITKFWSALLVTGVVFFIIRKWKGNFLALTKPIPKV